MLDYMEDSAKLSRIEEKLNAKILKAEMFALRQAMKKFPSMTHFTVENFENFWFSFGDGPKKYLHLYFTMPRGTKKKPDYGLRFIQHYVLNDIYTMLATVFPKYRAEFDCVRIEPHEDIWQFDLWHK